MNKAFKHRISIQLRMNDIDFMGHVNNSVIMEFFDLGKMEYLKQFGLEFNSQKKSNLIVVRHEVDFFQQIYFEDVLFVETRTEHFGNKSMQTIQQIIAGDQLKCECKTVLSGFDPSINSSCIIPDELKRKITLFENTHP